MAAKTKEPDAIVDEEPHIEPALPTVPTIAAVPGDDGWYGDADWIRVECDWPELKPRDGFEPMWAEIDASLTFQEAFAIPLQRGTPYAKLYPHVAPRVRAWNVREWDGAAGTFVPVPPPLEGGFQSFMRCRPIVISWLASVLRNTAIYGGPNRGEEPSESDEPRDSLNDDA